MVLEEDLCCGQIVRAQVWLQRLSLRVVMLEGKATEEHCEEENPEREYIRFLSDVGRPLDK